MNKLSTIKITGLAVLVAAAAYALNRPVGAPPVSADASGTAYSVLGLAGQPQAEAGKELVYVGMPAEPVAAVIKKHQPGVRCCGRRAGLFC